MTLRANIYWQIFHITKLFLRNPLKCSRKDSLLKNSAHAILRIYFLDDKVFGTIDQNWSIQPSRNEYSFNIINLNKHWTENRTSKERKNLKKDESKWSMTTQFQLAHSKLEGAVSSE